MSVGKISAACWGLFVVMCVAFMPLAYAVASLHSLSFAIRAVLVVVVVGALWWGPFGYAMYLSLAVMRSGDRRLLRRGIAGTAEVLSAKRTNTVIQEGEFAWEAPRVYKYQLRVSIPGKAPYETDCRICAAGIQQGQTVRVAVSRHNRKRVTIDVGQGGTRRGAGVPRSVPVSGGYPLAAATTFASEAPLAHDTERISALAQLGHLHSQGMLTDAEFATQKAKLLND